MLSILYGITGAMQAQVYDWAAQHATQEYLQHVYHGIITGTLTVGQYFS